MAIPPRVRSRCRFKNRGTEYVSESGTKRMCGRATRQRARPLKPTELHDDVGARGELRHPPPTALEAIGGARAGEGARADRAASVVDLGFDHAVASENHRHRIS